MALTVPDKSLLDFLKEDDLNAFNQKLELDLRTDNGIKTYELDRYNQEEFQRIRWLVRAQLELATPEAGKNINNAIWTGMDKLDVGYSTFLRLWEVFTDVFANRTNSDGETPGIKNTSFLKASANSNVSWTLGMISFVPLTIGFVLAIRNAKQERGRQSLDHLIKKINEINPADVKDHQWVRQTIAGLLEKQTLVNRSQSAPKEDKSTLGRFVRAVFGNAFVQKIETVWQVLVNSAMVFWPAWMIAVLIVGFGAATGGGVLAVLVPVTLAVSIVVHVIFNRISQHSQKKAEQAKKEAAAKLAKPEDLKEDDVKDFNHLQSSIAVRVHMKRHHQHVMGLFGGKKKSSSPKARTTVSAYRVICEKGMTTPVLIPKSQAELDAARKAGLTVVGTVPEVTDPLKKDKAAKSKIAQWVLGSAARQRGEILVNVVNEVIRQYTASAFALWLISSAVMAVSAIPALSVGVAAIIVTISNVIGGGLATAVGGAIVGAISGTRLGLEAVSAQNLRKDKLLSRLAETYLGKVVTLPNGKTTAGMAKHEVYDAFKEQNQFLRNDRGLVARLAAKQKMIRMKPAKDRNEQELHLLSLTISKNAIVRNKDTNDRYLRTLEQSPSAWVRFKKFVGNILYPAVNAGQSWIYVTRSLFLVGAVFGTVGLLGGPAGLAAFVAIATVMALAGITFKLTQNYFKRQQVKKDRFVETLDTRISSLRKQNEELVAVKEFLNGDPAVKSLPGVTTTARVAPVLSLVDDSGKALLSDAEKDSGSPSVLAGSGSGDASIYPSLAGLGVYSSGGAGYTSEPEDAAGLGAAADSLATAAFGATP